MEIILSLYEVAIREQLKQNSLGKFVEQVTRSIKTIDKTF